jgi:hypothetical protein
VEIKDARRLHLGTRIKEHGGDGPILDPYHEDVATWDLVVVGDACPEGCGCHANQARKGPARQGLSQQPMACGSTRVFETVARVTGDRAAKMGLIMSATAAMRSATNPATLSSSRSTRC